MIRKSTNLLLTRTLSNCLQNVIKRKNVGLTEVGRGSGQTRVWDRATKGLWSLGIPYSTFRGAGLEHSCEIYLVGNQKWNHVVLLCEARNTLWERGSFLLLLLILPVF